MPRSSRSVARLVAALALALMVPPARADYPDYSVGGSAAPPRHVAPAAHSGPTDSVRPVDPQVNNPAQRQFPLRYPSGERQPTVPAELVSNSDSAAATPQRLVARERVIPLSPPDESHSRSSTSAKPLVTGAASLGIVLGLFLLVVSVMRRAGPKTVGRLPREAIEILGRSPLVGRQQVHLVRCGNKLLLLCASAGSVETLTEITDPDEVDRLADICHRSTTQGVTTSLRQVFGHFARPKGLEYLSGHEHEEPDFQHLEAEAGEWNREARA